MLNGFLTVLGRTRKKDGRLLQNVKIFDYLGYLGAKSPFEKRYWFLSNSAAKQVFVDSGNAISGVSASLVSAGGQIDDGLVKAVKQDFLGTYAKDGLSAAAQAGNADYFGDENKVLYAFIPGTRDLKETSTNTRYKIWDKKPVSAFQLKVDSNFDYSYESDSTFKFRKVIVTNGVSYTFPPDINTMCTEESLITQYGKRFSKWFYPLNLSFDLWNPNQLVADGLSKDLDPFTFSSKLEIGGDSIPILTMNVRKSTDTCIIVGSKLDLSTSPSSANYGLAVNTWQEISFFIKIHDLSPVPTNVVLDLTDASGTPGAFARRNLKVGATSLFLPGGLVFLRFLLPTSTADNGWTVSSPRPTKFDILSIEFTPSTGYTGSVKLSQVYFFKRVRKTSATAAGTPVTTKLIVNRTIENEDVLQNMADEEYNRVSPQPYFGKMTIPGNTDFRKPGYNIDFDFVSTLGSGYSGTQKRMDEIIHTLNKSKYRTEIHLKPGFQRL